MRSQLDWRIFYSLATIVGDLQSRVRLNVHVSVQFWVFVGAMMVNVAEFLNRYQFWSLQCIRDTYEDSFTSVPRGIVVKPIPYI